MSSANSQNPHLILLPCPSPNLSLKSLKSEYGPGLAQALRKTSQISRQSAVSMLDIAVAYEDYPASGAQVMPLTYSRIQNLLALLYRLICIICTEESIDLRSDNDVNTSVILVKAYLGKDLETQDSNNNSKISLGDLRALANSRRSWKCLYYLDNEAGKTLFEFFIQSRNESCSHLCENLVSEGLEGTNHLGTLNQSSLSGTQQFSDHTSKRHYSVAVGGTFDHLHAGHKLLLTMAAFLVDSGVKPATSSERMLTIGVTGDKLLQNKQFIDELQDWNTRQACVEEFLLGMLEMISPSDNLKLAQPIPSSDSGARFVRNEFESGLIINYVEIFDPFGPTVTNKSISALVISRETRAGGKAVNDRRQAKGWSLLEVFEVDVLNADSEADSQLEQNEEFQSKISSTDIRRRLHERSVAS